MNLGSHVEVVVIGVFEGLVVRELDDEGALVGARLGSWDTIAWRLRNKESSECKWKLNCAPGDVNINDERTRSKSQRILSYLNRLGELCGNGMFPRFDFFD